jgi:hypothetical protein
LRLLRVGRPLRRLSLRDLPLRGLPLRGSAMSGLPLRRLRWPLLRTPLGLLRRRSRLTLRRSAGPGRLRCGSRRPSRPRLRRRRSILPGRLGSLWLLRRLRRRRTLRPRRNGIGRPFDIEWRPARGRRLCAGPERKIGIVGGHHHWNVGHGLRPQLDDPCLKLGIDTPEQRTDVEIEQRAIGIHHAAGFGPRRQRIKRALLERLHHVGPSA